MPNVNTLLDDHVTLRYECLDRIFLNGYVPRLQTPEGLARFLAGQPGEEIPRYAILGERTAHFMREVERLAEREAIPLVHFERGQRKEAIAQPHLDAASAAGREGVVLIGIAQERASVFRAPLKRDRQPGRYAAGRGSAYVNHVYFYVWDAEFGGGFIKVCTYAPWSVRVWCNGHAWTKRQLEGRHIGYQPLDNGIAAVDNGRALQEICDSLAAADIERFVRRWLSRLPSPFTPADAAAGYHYELSILQLPDQLHRGLRPSTPWPPVLRVGHSRPTRPGSAREAAAYLRTSHRPSPSGSLPHAGLWRRRQSQPTCRASGHHRQAVLEARSRPAHRDDHQRRLRLRSRSSADQPAGLDRDRARHQRAAHRPRA